MSTHPQESGTQATLTGDDPLEDQSGGHAGAGRRPHAHGSGDDNADAGLAAQALEFRVLHGPQAGSRLPLIPGQTYTVGSDEDCDIVLAGAQVQARHARLMVDGGGIRVQSLQGPVMANGLGEVGNPGDAGEAAVVALAAGSVLMLGRVRITVDAADAPWPQDDQIEQAPASPADRAATPGDTVEPPKADPSGATPSGSAMGVPTHARPVSRWPLHDWLLRGLRIRGASQPHRPLPSRKAWLRPGPAWVGGMMALLAATAGLGMILSDLNPVHPVAAPSPAAPTPVGLVAMTQTPTVAEAAPPSPAAVAQQQARRLQAVQAAASRLDPTQARLKVTADAQGHIVVGGAATSPALVQDWLAQLQREDAGLQTVENAVLYPPQLRRQFLQRLEAAGLASRLTVLSQEPELRLEGLLTPSERLRWEELFARFVDEHGAILAVRATIREERDQIAARIQTVVAGSFPYVMTTSGQRVAPGGRIDGRVLAAVRDGELVFADGMRVRVGP